MRHPPVLRFLQRKDAEDQYCVGPPPPRAMHFLQRTHGPWPLVMGLAPHSLINFGAVRGGHQAPEGQVPGSVPAAEARNRGAAGPVERCEEGSLAQDGDAGVLMVELRQVGRRRAVLVPASDPYGSLGDPHPWLPSVSFADMWGALYLGAA